MKKKFLFSFLLLLSLQMPLFAQAQSTMQVVDLQCEYLSEPIGIDVRTPRFNWKLLDLKNTRGQQQTAYHVLVASNKSLLNRNVGDLWDSGVVSSEQSTLINYEGKDLSSNQVCYWKVCACDKYKKSTLWSPVACFSMGLLHPEDWKGVWIKHPGVSEENHLWFRKTFKVNKKVESAFIHVASMGYHELYINGKKADDRILAPALTRLDKRALYITYDISGFLKVGNNVVSVWYGPGWSRYEFFKDHVSQAFRAQLDGKTTDGNSFSVHTDTSWKCQVSSSKNTGFSKYRDNGGECVNAMKYIANWNAVDFDDSQWPFVKKANLNVALSAQMMPPTRIIDTIQVQSVTDTIKGVYKADMGKNFTGWIELKMNGMSAGDTIVIMVADDPTSIQDFAQKNIYICKGVPGETFCNRFNYVAGRYINIKGLKQSPKLSDIKGYVIATDLKRMGHFLSSDTLFNQIYETDLWTYRICTTEGYTSDCPHRERLGYGEELYATAWGIGLPNYQSGSFYAKLLRDWTDVQEPNGWINHTVPQINKHFGGPMWSSSGLNIGWEYYQTYGDRRILEVIYGASKKWLDFLYQHSTSGLLEPYAGGGKFLGDWAGPGQRKEMGGSPESSFFNNCVYAMNLKTFVDIAGILGKNADVALYKGRLDSLKPKIQAKFFCPKTNTYLSGNQVQTAFPLWQNITPASLYPTVLSHFEKEMTLNHPFLDMGSSGLPVLLKFLTEDHEYNDVMASILSKTDEPSYGYFLKRGETAWPEYWNVDVPSRIHTCYTGIASWFIKCVGGIRPDPLHPGYQSFLIKPAILDNLLFADAETESLYGSIKCSWKKEGNKLRINISVPVNSQAIVYFPANGEDYISESGKPLAKVLGIHVLKQEGPSLLLQLKSGNYEFIRGNNANAIQE